MTVLAEIRQQNHLLVIGDADADRLATDYDIGTVFRGPTGNEWDKIAEGTTEAAWNQTVTDGARNAYGLAKNAIPWTAAQGKYSATEVYGLLVSAQGSADYTVTPVGGVEITVPKECFVAGNEVHLHCSEITLGTGGEALLYIG